MEIDHGYCHHGKRNWEINRGENTMKKSTMATVRWRNRPWLLSPWKTKLGNRPWRKYDEEIDHGYCTMEKSTWLLSPWKMKLGKRNWENDHGENTMKKSTMAVVRCRNRPWGK
ncbi:hypothetical protein L6452_42231 [Arctium lappa]|uniref:Uncharacterized protein n=1 Tax=Arctium lappa TaxID=4217 RepID=A0ACB8XHX5_ARCLA|nr:hypothetical protein L6452_42231 [Arctium lappa]